MLEQLATEAPTAAPYVGGGIGVAALMWGVSRITAAVLSLRDAVSRHLAAWETHRLAAEKHWSVEENLLEHLAEERRQRDIEAQNARRFLTEQNTIRGLKTRVAELEAQLEAERAGQSAGSS